MKRIIICILLCTISMGFSIKGNTKEIQETSIQRLGVVPYEDDEVYVDGCGIGMPLDKILLIRKNKKYCTVKFTKFWTKYERTEKYATYEVYYQKDGTGNFLNKNVKFKEGQASILPPRGSIRPFLKQPGYTKVDCGSLNLEWGYKGFVSFHEGYECEDQGIEVAPTPWSDVKEVNVFDSRIKWYRYDKSIWRGIHIPINELWK